MYDLIPEPAREPITRQYKHGSRAANHSATNHAARALSRARHDVEFIGVDGEGITLENGRHEYILLSVGEESHHRKGDPLSFDDIAEFLWDCYITNPSAVYVGFYLSYDFTMWLRGLPENRARMLLTTDGAHKRMRKMGRNPIPFPVEYGNWQFDMHAGKRFKIRPKGETKWMYVCDCGPFYQSSLLTALNPKNWPEPILSDAEYEIIREGKEKRATAQFDTSMIRYNVAENLALAKMMAELNKGLTQLDLRLKKNQWYGPGQVAQVWLNQNKAPTRDDAKANIPLEVLEAGRWSYYGGWFEIPAHGIIYGISYEYDENSAYPNVIKDLPCFAHGTWSRREAKPNGLTLVDATVSQTIPQRLGTMPHRTRDGRICRPRKTRGWYWLHEIEAAQRAHCIQKVVVHDSWSYRQTCNHKPFGDVAKLYKMRQEVGKNSPLGKALKLLINSIYGKLAQSVGEPRYANPLYASLVTSGCRTDIWNAIATHPKGSDAVTMIATDGVYFTSPHPGLPLSDKLGEWSMETHSNLCQFMPGLYWDDRVRENPKEGQVHSRGINAKDLRNVINRLDAQWELFRERYEKKRDGVEPDITPLANIFGVDMANKMRSWPFVSVPIAFGLVSAKLAIHRNDWAKAGTIPIDPITGKPKPRRINGDPSDKRDTATTYADFEGRLWTEPYEVAPDGIQSTPYEERFGLELRDIKIEDDIVSQDGIVKDEVYEWMMQNG